MREFFSPVLDSVPPDHLSQADFQMTDGSDLGSLSSRANDDSSVSLSCQFYQSGSYNNIIQSDYEALDFPSSACVGQLQYSCRFFSTALTQHPTGYILDDKMSGGFPCVPLSSHGGRPPEGLG